MEVPQETKTRSTILFSSPTPRHNYKADVRRRQYVRQDALHGKTGERKNMCEYSSTTHTDAVNVTHSKHIGNDLRNKIAEDQSRDEHIVDPEMILKNYKEKWRDKKRKKEKLEK